jgi:hypothetical protein
MPMEQTVKDYIDSLHVKEVGVKDCLHSKQELIEGHSHVFCAHRVYSWLGKLIYA